MRSAITFFLYIFFLLSACDTPSGNTEKSYQRLQGETMGTYYRVTYSAAAEKNYQSAVDSVLLAVNMEVSTYIDTSIISRFNQAERTFMLDKIGSGAGDHFLANYEVAKEVFEKSEGAFDPTVMPLVNYWGFGYTEKKEVTAVDSVVIDSLIRLVGFNKVTLEQDSSYTFIKSIPEVEFDFSGCAKGYGVDAVAMLLELRGTTDYLVDIGGEVRAKGNNPRGTAWNIGINEPRENAGMTEIQVSVPLVNRSVATSGNYRNFYEVNGIKYSHTINPRTGFPERNSLLSASVFAKDCMTADAYATAFMVMGAEKALALASRLPDIDAYFIFGKPDGSFGVSYTKGLNNIFENK